MNKEKSCTIGGACGVGLLGILCPFCIPAVATFFFSLGLGFVVNEGVLWGIFALFSILFLTGLFSGYHKHQNIVPLFLGILGLISIAIGAYILFSRPLMWGGVTAAVLAALWNILLVRRAAFSIPLLAVLAIIAVTAIGFLGYQIGFLRFISNVMMPGDFGSVGLLLLSALFGTAAFFSPCALTVLPAYVSHFLGVQGTESRKPSFTELLSLGVIGALGIIVVNMALGLVIAALGSAAPFAKDPREDIVPILAIRTIAGLLIALMGYLTITGKRLPIPFVQELIASGNLRKSIFTYGVFYNAAAVGCTGPILLGLMLYAFQFGEAKAALGAFSVFSLTMGVWMIFLTLLAGLFKGAIMQRIALPLPALRIVTGIVMVIVGLSVTILTLEGNRIFVKLFFPFLP